MLMLLLRLLLQLLLLTLLATTHILSNAVKRSEHDDVLYAIYPPTVRLNI